MNLQNLQTTLVFLKDKIYTKYFCEENIWHLCKEFGTLQFESDVECYSVFISNSNRSVILWNQEVEDKAGDFVIWVHQSRNDYHVIAIYGNRINGYSVLDFDSTLSFPVSFKEYALKAIRTEEMLSTQYKRCFRVISAADYVKYFSSDRRHMRMGDSWSQPPPKYSPIIQNEDNPHNLDEFICMEKNTGYGYVLNYQEFMEKFAIK